MSNLPRQIYHNYFVKYLPVISVSAFVFGVWINSQYPLAALFINKAFDLFISSYAYFVPFLIYVILTPSLVRIFHSEMKGGNHFVRRAVIWFAIGRVVAACWAVVFTAIAFGVPLYTNSTLGFGTALVTASGNLLKTLATSHYFYALYASFLTLVFASRLKFVLKTLQSVSDGVEKIGEFFFPLVPLFMMAIGIYISDLPFSLPKEIASLTNVLGVTTTNSLPASIKIFGIPLSANLTSRVITAYLAGGILVGLVTFIWHGALLLLTKLSLPKFSLRKYFRDYWLKIYPLLWSTSSEALSTPFNLYLIKINYPQVRTAIRRFVVGAETFLNVNGTIMCVFILAGLVASLLGIEFSLIQLFLLIPVVVIMGYGLPGIPGELLLFAGPVATFLEVSPQMLPIFLALYIGFQIGLPDSFRTGVNSTDSCLFSLLMEKYYQEKFERRKATRFPSGKVFTINLAKSIQKR